jgi:hypothetical protein
MITCSDYLGAGSESAPYTGPVQTFIMAATRAVTYDVTPATLKTLFESQSTHKYEDKISQVYDLLKKKFPKVEPVVFNYQPQAKKENRESGAWGKMAVSLISTLAHLS